MVSKVKPISPAEVTKTKALIFPPEVIAAFNYLIAKNFRSGYSTIKFKDAKAEITEKLNLKVGDIFESWWLDVEDVYRKEGWVVTVDSPGFNESYDGSYTFKAPK